jgi:hypothetical protein
VSLGFLWFVVALKIPLIALVFAVWWAIREEPEDSAPGEDDGGIRKPDAADDRHRPLKPFPRHPRRGPHGDPAPPSPARVRTVRARARTYGH